MSENTMSTKLVSFCYSCFSSRCYYSGHLIINKKKMRQRWLWVSNTNNISVIFFCCWTI